MVEIGFESAGTFKDSQCFEGPFFEKIEQELQQMLAITSGAIKESYAPYQVNLI